jgi:hypothetical protein
MMSIGTGSAARRSDAWLTAVLRPAGNLDAAQVERLGGALEALAASSDMVILDLGAATVRQPTRLAATLRAPARQLARPGSCLLLVSVPADLLRILARSGIQAATLAA